MPFREDLRPARLVPVEEEVLALWEREGTFAASVEARRGAEPWVFYDGPPTANGKPGIHHLISRSVKDFACRWWTMRGRLVERRAGWDTHGLPVEIETEKKLGIQGQGKAAIEKLGVAKFNAACRESVFTYLKEWEEFTRRTGYWVDLKGAYVTCSNEYVESLWSILADWHRRGLLVKGHKVLPYCPRCETPLSSHEVGQGFRDVQDPSVYVRFKALASDGTPLEESFLVWTTTPWTLPSNVALAVHPDVDYVKVRLAHGDGTSELLWLAEPRLAALKAKPEQVHVVDRVKGAVLVGRPYRRLLDLYDVAAAQNAFTVRPATFVTTEDGTGVVHMAPAYGEDDAAIGRRDALPTLHPVDGRGRFVEGPRAAPVAGKFVKDADKDVVHLLKAAGAMFRHETVVHSYPHCWRCETPLLYYARDSWYAKTTNFRDRMIALNAATSWYPEATGHGRMGEWLENNVDWAISRDRYWGTPLPIWLCDGPKCGAQEAIESLKELQGRAGRLPDPLDLHRPHVDVLTWPCRTKGCKGTMRRTPEVADCWFDSGSMPFAGWHYPFENKALVEARVPAHLVAEGVDQTRGWFYTLLAVAVMVSDKPAYLACVSNDMVLDAKGKKMSKSRGNVVDPMALVAKFGADVVRWHLLTSRPVWLPLRFDEADVLETRNRLFGTLAATYGFFAMYANVDGFEGAPPPAAWRPSDVFDRWLLSRLSGLVSAVTEDLSAYETSKAGKRIADFVVEDLSNWYVRRNRRRFWKGAMTDDKREGYRTLHAALSTVVRLMAPFSPFVTDAIYRALSPRASGAASSVHLADWPEPLPAWVDERLELEMEWLRTVVSLGHSVRQRERVTVRWPIAAISIDPWVNPTTGLEAGRSQYRLETMPWSFFEASIKDELNVKQVKPMEVDYENVPRGMQGVLFDLVLDKRLAAPRLGPDTKVVVDRLSALRLGGHQVDSDVDVLARLHHSLAQALLTGVEAEINLPLSDGRTVMLRSSELALQPLEGSPLAWARGFTVELDTERTVELDREGTAREFIHALQNLRKAKGLSVADRVHMTWAAEECLAEAVAENQQFISDDSNAKLLGSVQKYVAGGVDEVLSIESTRRHQRSVAEAIRVHRDSVAEEILAVDMTEDPKLQGGDLLRVNWGFILPGVVRVRLEKV